MFQEDYYPFFQSAIFQSTGKELNILSYEFISGGNINNTVKLVTETDLYFIKWNEDPTLTDLFEQEAIGLNELSKGPIRTPTIIGENKTDGKPYLLLEFIHKSAPIHRFWETFGVKLAEQHLLTKPDHGFSYNNHIGKLPQKNEWKHSWFDFFTQCRLEVQLGLAIYNGHIDATFAKKFRQLYPKLPDLIPEAPASLLHGDLWSGNFMTHETGLPTLIDPAVYYGHREMELAFTHLFGGFDVSFYHEYQNVYPVEKGFFDRIDLFNLYPLLVHVNLFGTSYLSGIKLTLKKYL